MNDDIRQILDLLAQGKVNAEEAERLIAALEKPSVTKEEARKNPPKYLRILVESDEEHLNHGPSKVNVRVPIQLLRAGVKLASVVPVQAKNQINAALKENGIEADISKITPENIEELIENLNDLTVDVDDKHSKVRIFCE